MMRYNGQYRQCWQGHPHFRHSWEWENLQLRCSGINGPLCDNCVDGDHALCIGTEDCWCNRCNVDPITGKHARSSWYNILYDPLPDAGSKARPKWIGRHAPVFNDGYHHFHALYNRGRVMWVESGPSKVCKQEGRCKVFRVEEV